MAKKKGKKDSHFKKEIHLKEIVKMGLIPFSIRRNPQASIEPCKGGKRTEIKF